MISETVTLITSQTSSNSASPIRSPYDDVAFFVASSILMDAYPPNMPAFDPRFRTLYKKPCIEALAKSYGTVNFAEYECRSIEEHLVTLHIGCGSESFEAAALHRLTPQPPMVYAEVQPYLPCVPATGT